MIFDVDQFYARMIFFASPLTGAPKAEGELPPALF
jgi:hypothetical protein